MTTLATAVLRYLHEVLGIEARGLKPWARANELPYFLRDAFQFSELELLGQPIVLAIGHAQAKQSLSEVRTWLDKIKALAGQPTVYVTDALASYDRRRLIENKVPFIVPGNQLYLPDLGLDLREYFRQRAPAADASLSPSAQAMLITVLLRQQWQPNWQPSKVAAVPPIRTYWSTYAASRSWKMSSPLTMEVVLSVHPVRAEFGRRGFPGG